MKYLIVCLVALSLAACTEGLPTRSTPLPIGFAVPQGCTLQQVKSNYWQCNFPSADGRLRLIQISNGLYPTTPEQALEMTQADAATQQAALREVINDTEKERAAGFNHSRYKRIRSNFLPSNRVTAGYIACLSTRESFVERGYDMTNDRAYLHCWGWDAGQAAFTQLVFSYLEANQPSLGVSPRFDSDAARVIGSIQKR